MQSGAGTAQDVALAKQGGDIAGHGGQAKILTAQQQVGDTWMGR